VQGSLIGVGPALRKARERRGVTVDEASRGTKLRADALDALEDERFDALLGEVYVRAALRTYSTYLGLDAEKVLEAYVRGSGARPPPPPEPPEGIRRAIDAARRRGDYAVAIAIVVVIAVAAAALGVLSNRSFAPAAARLRTVSPADAHPSTVIVSVAATHRVQAVVTIDGVQQRAILIQPGESRTFEAEEFLSLRLAHGGARLAVNGTDYGVVGTPEDAWEGTFSPTSIASPSVPGVTGAPSGTVSGSSGSGASGATSSPSA
jgi:Helix-turn-helix domain